MKHILNTLFQHQNLSREDAKRVMTDIAQKQVDPFQVAAFLSVFKMRQVQVEELLGFRDALLELAIPVNLSDFDAIDLCGTGGDGKNTFNVSTLSAFVTAGAGIKVAKHGNYGVSSVCGSSNVLESLGYQFSNKSDVLKRQIDHCNITVLHAPLFHPALKEVSQVRKGFGLSSVFNLLGPMVNPSSPKNQLIGVFNPEVLRLYQYVYQQLDIQHILVHSLDGYDEISLTGPCKIIKSDSDGIFQASDLGFEKLQEDDLFGGDTIEDAAKIFMQVLKNNCTPAQKSVVMANAAMAIHCAHPDSTYAECKDLALESLESGRALNCFQKLIKLAA